MQNVSPARFRALDRVHPGFPRPRGFESLRIALTKFAGLALLAMTIGCASRATVAEAAPDREEEANQVAVAEEEIVAILSALVEFAIDNYGEYPDQLDMLTAPDDDGWVFLPGEGTLVDPWGNAYQYIVPTRPEWRPEVYSWGADGKPGGEGADADVVAPRSR